MSDILLSSPYSPGAAENGKFTLIDPEYLQTKGYPASGGSGRFAIFTYQINNPSQIKTEEVQKTTNTLVCSVCLDGGDGKVFIFDTPVLWFEIYNNSTDAICFRYDTEDFVEVEESGMIVNANAYYTSKQNINIEKLTVSTTNSATADIRMFVYTY